MNMVIWPLSQKKLGHWRVLREGYGFFHLVCRLLLEKKNAW